MRDFHSDPGSHRNPSSRLSWALSPYEPAPSAPSPVLSANKPSPVESEPGNTQGTRERVGMLRRGWQHCREGGNIGEKVGALERGCECWREDGNARGRVGMLRRE